jgi:hypothetical protein
LRAFHCGSLRKSDFKRLDETVTLDWLSSLCAFEPTVFGDVRRFFFESFNQQDFNQASGLKGPLCKTTTAAAPKACYVACNT